MASRRIRTGMELPAVATGGSSAPAPSAAVCALIVGDPAHPRLFAQVVDAVAAQSRPAGRMIAISAQGAERPEGWETLRGEAARLGDAERGGERPNGWETLRVPAASGTAGGFERGLSHAMRGPSGWFWLVDGVSVPRPDALEQLLASTADAPHAPQLLSGRVVAADGSLHPDAWPWPDIFEIEMAIEACERHLVVLRAARHGSLLVRRDALARAGLPLTPYVDSGDDLEWTARMLRGGVPAYLVPSSVSVRATAPRDERDPELVYRHARNSVATLCGNSWSANEKIWLGVLLAQYAAAQARGGRGSLRPLLLGLRDGALRRSRTQSVAHAP